MALDSAAVRAIVRWRHDYVQAFRDIWGSEPDAWQADVLRLACRRDTERVRIAMQACVGVGKTAMEAVLGWLFLLLEWEPELHPDNPPHGYALSISADNLKSNLWRELAVWHAKSPILSRLFVVDAEMIYARENRKWWLMFRSYAKSATPEQQGAALAGLHGPYIFVLLDEMGTMPPAVGRKAEQIMSQDDLRRGMILGGGNPTDPSGLLYDVATSGAWDVSVVTGDPDDPKRSPRMSLAWAEKMIARHGRDNPWVMAHVLGKFPPTGLNTLLTPDEVRAAMARTLPEHEYAWAQKRIGVDVARFGLDSTVLFPRQGKMFFRPVVLRQQDTNAIAARLLKMSMAWSPEAIIIDDTGHWGHGVVDNLTASGAPVHAVQFHDRKTFKPRYYNRRAEGWFELAEGIKHHGWCLPNDPELLRDLCAVQYYYDGGCIRLEDKDQVKKRTGHSPDLGDGAAVACMLPDMPGEVHAPIGDVVRHGRKYSGAELEEARVSAPPDWTQGHAVTGHVVGDYDPFSGDRD